MMPIPTREAEIIGTQSWFVEKPIWPCIRATKRQPNSRKSSTIALARLQLARAFAMQGDTAKAKAAYQDFLTLWKDADPDIPILVAAKAEYAKLK